MGSLNVQQTIPGAHPLLIWVRADWIVPSLVWLKGFKCVPGEEGPTSFSHLSQIYNIQYGFIVVKTITMITAMNMYGMIFFFFFEEHLGTM